MNSRDHLIRSRQRVPFEFQELVEINDEPSDEKDGAEELDAAINAVVSSRPHVTRKTSVADDGLLELSDSYMRELIETGASQSALLKADVFKTGSLHVPAPEKTAFSRASVRTADDHSPARQFLGLMARVKAAAHPFAWKAALGKADDVSSAAYRRFFRAVDRGDFALGEECLNQLAKEIAEQDADRTN